MIAIPHLPEPSFSDIETDLSPKINTIGQIFFLSGKYSAKYQGKGTRISGKVQNWFPHETDFQRRTERTPCPPCPVADRETPATGRRK